MFCLFAGEQESLSSSQNINVVVLICLIVIVCAYFAKNVHRWNRKRHIRTHKIVPVHYKKSASAPPTVKFGDFMASTEPNRVNSVVSPQQNVLLEPPAVSREGSVQPVYDDQIAIINRTDNDVDDNDNEPNVQRQQQQQNNEQDDQQQDQRRLMRATLNCTAQNTCPESSIELINFDDENVITLDSGENGVAIL